MRIDTFLPHSSNSGRLGGFPTSRFYAWSTTSNAFVWTDATPVLGQQHSLWPWIKIEWAGTWRGLGEDEHALLVSSSSNRLVVMLEKALCVKGFPRDGEGLAKCGEI